MDTPPVTDLVPDPETSLASLDTSSSFLAAVSSSAQDVIDLATAAATAADSPRPFALSYFLILLI